MRVQAIIACVYLFALCIASAALPAKAAPPSAAEACKRLGRGVNFGNALDAPNEGEWGVTLKAEYFKAIRQAGFDSVRLPVRWSNHALAESPYTINAKFAERVDWALDQAEANGLSLVLNVHHYGEMDADPNANLPRLLVLWRQIAERYKDRPPTVCFELFNEPHDKFVDENWNAAIPQLLEVIRKTNPTRPVIVGPPFWNAIWALDKLQLPKDDPHLILTIHSYDPFEFTHQGAPWAAGSEKWKGRTWTGTDEDQAAVRAAFDKTASWAKERGLPVYLGEFGAFEQADMASRARWTHFVAREAERHGFSWSYWEFCSGFGVYNPQSNEWRKELKSALID